MQFKSNQRLFITGRTGSGKTYFVLHSFFYRLQRVIIHDRKHDLSGLKATYAHTPQDIIWCWQHNRYRVVYQPYNPSTEDFDEVCKLIFNVGNYVFVADEVASYATANYIPYYFSELLRLGRVRNIGVISLSQRPRHVFNTVMSEADYIIAFQLHLETDRKKVAEVVGSEAMKLNEIPRYHYLMYNAYEGCSWHKPI